MQKIIFLFLIAFFITGCTTTMEDYNQLQRQLNELRHVQRQDKLQFQDTIQTLEQEIAALQEQTEKLMDQTAGGVRSIQADLWSGLEAQKVELATIKGMQEEARLKLLNLEQQQSAREQEIVEMQEQLQVLDSQVQQVISQLGLEIESKISSADAEPRPESRDDIPGPETDPAQQIYEQALESFNQREYAQAISLWSEFMESFSEHELVPNAYFWQGESYYQLQDYAQAALQYQEIIENFPESSKYPTSLLKQGLSFYHLDKNKAGRILLQELIDEYPDSAEAKRARIFLQER